MITTLDFNNMSWALKDLCFRLRSSDKAPEFETEIYMYEKLQAKINGLIRELTILEDRQQFAQIGIELNYYNKSRMAKP